MYFKPPEFIGPFKNIIPEYIQYKRGLGYDYGAPIVYRLREMDIFFLEHGYNTSIITEEMYNLWIALRVGEKKTNQGKRHSAINGFSKYLIEAGYKDIYIAEAEKGIFKTNFIPYIFSKAEINKMFEVLQTELKAAPISYDTAAFAVLFSLYYGCGLRKSEGQHLRIKDIDVIKGKLQVIDGKNHVSRLIMLSESIRKQLAFYMEYYCIGCDDDDYLFRGKNTECFSESKIYNLYKQLLKKSGIPKRTDGKSQRIHDLRHTFCVRTLESMVDKGYDLYTSLPLLTKYLGHKHITETEYYLRMLDENFRSVVAMADAYTNGLIPEVGDTDV